VLLVEKSLLGWVLDPTSARKPRHPAALNIEQPTRNFKVA
jgi:hypothetical protein